MYRAACQGQTTQRTKFWCKQKPLVTSVIFYKFQKISFKPEFIQFFITLYMYIALRQGLTNPSGEILMSTGTSYHFGHLLQVSKKISLKSDFIHLFFMILYMFIAPGQCQIALRGQSLISTEMSCHFIHLLQVSNKCLWSLILNSFFFMI